MATDTTETSHTRPQMDYDTKIFPHSGGYGRYNRLVVVFSWFPNFAVMLNLISDVFYTLIPDTYHCKPDPQLLPSTFLLSNFSRQGYLNLTIPWVNGTGLSHCELFKYPPNTSDLSENVPRERVSCTRGWEFAHAAGLQSNFVTEWNLVCSDYWKIPLQHICFMTGWILGYIFLGTLCDWLGRRRGFLFSISLSSLLGVAVCLSSSAVVFLLLRLSQGAMLAGVFVSSYIIRLELCDPPHRLMVAMVSGFFAVFAELLLPGIAVLCRDWPVLQAVATLPLLLLLSYWCCASVFPESPRWLLATAQIPQVKRSLQEFSTRNGVCLRDEIYPGETLLSDIDTAYGEDCRPRYHSVLELRQTRIIWKNCLILSFTLFIGTGIQYCFTRNLHSYSTNFYFSYFLRVITGALACIFICLTVNHFGRRGILLFSAIITGLSSLLLLALTQYLHGGLVLVLSVVGLLFSQALAMLSVFFACEVMPTVVRGGCLGLVLAAGCVGMAASSLMELQNNSGYFLHHVIFASFAVLSVLCIMLLPESKRKPLPNSLKEGESQRRPPLFLSRPDRDNLPLLRTRPPLSEYNPDNYSRLVSATRRMLTKDTLPYRIAVPSHSPLLSDSETQGQENETPREVTA
ncbi:putative solute carrier family 22 member 31 [Seriola lalandi dorsalis]|uniref:putative solute carrier family 22 member 31 n=1 Tax=Seriola lalandi dorsalis TaxID=1841481 RepID=UPI000C6F763E|nr:putative solute carrier family 22 member 31 [Seriola lalandi dorsalis]XP_056234642.1 putative solute carrier family 22 member 31 [Seriola aureovittata]